LPWVAAPLFQVIIIINFHFSKLFIFLPSAQKGFEKIGFFVLGFSFVILGFYFIIRSKQLLSLGFDGVLG
jgi:hypothetical protein